MNLAFKIIVYFACTGYAIFKAYQLGFGCGEDKGRRDMQEFMISGTKKKAGVR